MKTKTKTKKKKKLTDHQKLVTKQLIKILTAKKVPITYGDLAQSIGKPNSVRAMGRTLGSISTKCDELDLPLISAIVVNKKKKEPGKGFILLLNKLKPGVTTEDETNAVINREDWTVLENEI